MVCHLPLKNVEKFELKEMKDKTSIKKSINTPNDPRLSSLSLIHNMTGLIIGFLL